MTNSVDELDPNGSGTKEDGTNKTGGNAKPPSLLKLSRFAGSGEYTLLVKEGYLSESEVTSELETQAPYQDKMMNTKITTTTNLKVTKK